MRSPLVACLLACGSRAPPVGNVADTEREVLVFRQLHAGLVRPTASVTTYTLRRERERITLEIRRAIAPTRPEAPLSGWKDQAPTVYRGTASRHEAGLVLELSGDEDQLVLHCTRTTLAIAGADAVRTRTPGMYDEGDEQCGDTGTWSPAATLQLPVLACREPGEPREEPADPDDEALAAEEALAAQLSFGEPPGIEYLHVNDDCDIQGGGLRRIPRDGSIFAVRR
jgi:hypothetical protein